MQRILKKHATYRKLIFSAVNKDSSSRLFIKTVLHATDDELHEAINIFRHALDREISNRGLATFCKRRRPYFQNHFLVANAGAKPICGLGPVPVLGCTIHKMAIQKHMLHSTSIIIGELKMSRYFQQSIFKSNAYKNEFGGSRMVGRRKGARPLSTKLPIHLVLRSTQSEARRVFSYRSKRNRQILAQLAKRFHIQIYESVFNYTHLHLVIRIPHRQNYVGFIRQLSSRLSRLANLKRGALFGLRPYTRILSWGREFKTVMSYMNKNYVEAIGTIVVTNTDIGWDTVAES